MNEEVYRQNVGWEEKIDADAEAKRLADFIENNVKCRADHVRPKEQERCVCGSWSAYYVTKEDLP